MSPRTRPPDAFPGPPPRPAAPRGRPPRNGPRGCPRPRPTPPRGPRRRSPPLGPCSSRRCRVRARRRSRRSPRGPRACAPSGGGPRRAPSHPSGSSRGAPAVGPPRPRGRAATAGARPLPRRGAVPTCAWAGARTRPGTAPGPPAPRPPAPRGRRRGRWRRGGRRRGRGLRRRRLGAPRRGRRRRRPGQFRGERRATSGSSWRSSGEPLWCSAYQLLLGSASSASCSWSLSDGRRVWGGARSNAPSGCAAPASAPWPWRAKSDSALAPAGGSHGSSAPNGPARLRLRDMRALASLGRATLCCGRCRLHGRGGRRLHPRRTVGDDDPGGRVSKRLMATVHPPSRRQFRGRYGDVGLRN